MDVSRQPSPSPPIPEHGPWTEEFARLVSAGGGQPDFVFRPLEVIKGRARREVGDHLILLGHQLVIASVKSRDVGMQGKDTEPRARSWLGKHIEAAGRQIEGTRRTLWGSPPPLLRSERGVEVAWNPSRVTDVIGLILINYTPPPDYVPAVTGSTPTVTLLVRHWAELNRVLGSTAAVIECLRWRVQQAGGIALADELDLFGAALARSPSQVILPGDLAGAWDLYVSSHPEVILGCHPDHRYTAAVLGMIARAYEQDPSFPPLAFPGQYLDVVEVLERLRLGDRIGFGKKVYEKCWLAHQQNRRRFFVYDDGNGGSIVFLADPAGRPGRTELLKILTLAEHNRSLESGDNVAQRTLGIATEPYPDSGLSHDFVLAKGEFPVPPEVRRALKEFLDASTGPPRSVNPEILSAIEAVWAQHGKGKPGTEA